jgi:hypothetical protein
MLKDVHVELNDIFHILGWNAPYKVETGIFADCNFNFTNAIPHTARRETSRLPHELDAYGVVDSIEQWKKIYWPLMDPRHDGGRHFAVGFTTVRKSKQPRTGGWRWHKWGPYLGDHSPECEYLYNEPSIKRVETFVVVELARCDQAT